MNLSSRSSQDASSAFSSQSLETGCLFNTLSTFVDNICNFKTAPNVFLCSVSSIQVPDVAEPLFSLSDTTVNPPKNEPVDVFNLRHDTEVPRPLLASYRTAVSEPQGRSRRSLLSSTTSRATGDTALSVPRRVRERRENNDENGRASVIIRSLSPELRNRQHRDTSNASTALESSNRKNSVFIRSERSLSPNDTDYASIQNKDLPQMSPYAFGERWLAFSAHTLKLPITGSLQQQRLRSLISPHVTTDSVCRLEKERNAVKSCLKDFDLRFAAKYGSPPTREEKESLRPLYVYYRTVKTALQQAQDIVTQTDHDLRRRNEQSPSAVPKPETPRNRNPSINTARSFSFQQSRRSLVERRSQSLSATSPDCLTQRGRSCRTSCVAKGNPLHMSPGRRQSLNTEYSLEPTCCFRSPTSTAHQTTLKSLPRQSYDCVSPNISSIVTSRRHRSVDVADRRSRISLRQPPSSTSQRRSCSEHSSTRVETHLRQLQDKKTHIRRLLEEFQKDFFRAHQRPIRYHSDIHPVRREYMEYKSLKKMIKDVLAATHDRHAHVATPLQ